MRPTAIHRTYVGVTIATAAALVAEGLARRAQVVTGWRLGFTASGDTWEQQLWGPDPALTSFRSFAWLLAVGLTLALTLHAVEQVRPRPAGPRWVAVATATGAAVGLVVGTTAWWLERPGTLVTPGAVGLRAVTEEAQSLLGPLRDVIGSAVAFAGHDVWLIGAPVLCFALYGALAGLVARLVRALVPPRPNVALKLSGDG